MVCDAQYFMNKLTAEDETFKSSNLFYNIVSFSHAAPFQNSIGTYQKKK